MFAAMPDKASQSGMCRGRWEGAEVGCDWDDTQPQPTALNPLEKLLRGKREVPAPVCGTRDKF